MTATPGAPLREIRYEETTWKARPDWSPDGTRVVYSSYLGRQWNQLWLMTSEGGDVFPLTYGEFDATAPRWARDGRRIAYVSNEGGNTSLWVMDVPGGRRQRILAIRRRYHGPVGRLRLEVVDHAGRRLPARISVTRPDGRAYAPDDAWRHVDEAFDRGESGFEYGYFHTSGSTDLTVPAGAVHVAVWHGPEFGVGRAETTVRAGGTTLRRIVLDRVADLPAQGWWSGDLHVHMNYGGAYRDTPEQLAFQGRAEDVHVIENLVVNKEQRIPDIAYFRTDADPVSSRNFLLLHGQEFHTSYWGHAALLGLTDHYLLPAGAGPDAFPNFASLRGPPGLVRVFAQAGTRLDRRDFLAALKAGHTFVSNAPLLEFTLDGRRIGEEIRLPRGGGTLVARVRLRSSVPVDHLEIIGNGRVVAAIPLTGDRTQASAAVPVTVAGSGWYVLRAYADRAELPVLDRYPSGSASPVYVTVGNEPVRSSEDADFFMRWIDRLDDAAEAHQGWNTAAEREHVLRLLAEARAVYAGRGVSGAPARSPGSP